MIKKCQGCGVILQSEDIKKEGYVDIIDKDVCERCFKLTNYGEYKEVTLTNSEHCKYGAKLIGADASYGHFK